MALDLFQNRDVPEKVSVTFNPELVSNDGAVGIRESRRAVFNILSSVCVDIHQYSATNVQNDRFFGATTGCRATFEALFFFLMPARRLVSDSL